MRIIKFPVTTQFATLVVAGLLAACGGGGDSTIASNGDEQRLLRDAATSELPKYRVTVINPPDASASPPYATLGTQINKLGHFAGEYGSYGAAGWPRTFFYDGTQAIAVPSPHGARPAGINDSDQIVGAMLRCNRSDASPPVSYLWSKADGFNDIFAKAGCFGATEGGFPLFINASGLTAGRYCDSAGCGTFRWSPGAAISIARNFSPAGDRAALSDSGQIAGWIDGDDRWTVLNTDNTTTTLRQTDGQAIPGRAVAIRGDTVYGSTDADGREARWRNGTLEYLWSPPPGEDPVFWSSSRLGLSPSGNAAVGTAAVQNSSGGDLQHFSWVWIDGRGTFNLPSAPDGNYQAVAINDEGIAVGNATSGGSATPFPFIWTAEAGAVDLRSRLIDAPDNLVLNSADQIGNGGHVVATSNAGLLLLTPDTSLRPMD